MLLHSKSAILCAMAPSYYYLPYSLPHFMLVEAGEFCLRILISHGIHSDCTGFSCIATVDGGQRSILC